MSGLKVNLLGPFEATYSDDRRLHFPTTKAQALLAYLMVEDRQQPGVSHPRGHLMLLLWPDILPGSAQVNLRQTLYRLRQSLHDFESASGESESLLLSDRQCVRLNPAVKYRLDVAEFESALKQAARESRYERIASLSKAAALYRGDFLRDVYIPDSEAFENWAGQVREHLSRQAINALGEIGEDALVQGDDKQAQDMARRQIAIDDLHEEAYRLLMRSLSANDQRNEALSEFARLTQLLEEELGVESAKETVELADAIRRGESAQRPDGTPTRPLGSKSVPSDRHAEATSQDGNEIDAPDFADRQSTGPPSNLPYELNRFVGRQKHIAAITDLFEQQDTRLVTLTGPGGVGKTRLATRLASDLRHRFQDGVWLVELAPLTNPALIAQTAVRTLALLEEEGQPLIQTLIEYLRPRHLLLILDNCEHLIEDAAQFAHSILRAAPNLHILATSREPLDTEGEIIWTLPPLSSPAPEEEVTPESLVRYEATDLFVDRVAAIQPQFTVNQQNAPAVAQVCTCLDGIPLAIELAAARLKAMSVEDVAARLDDRFQFLVGYRTSAPRQQTLQALIDWSYDLLHENERILMRRLSVFAGGWSMEAAEYVCSGGEIGEVEVLDLLAQLIDKSLVVAKVQQSGTRYTFLETIRQYAADRLVESAEVNKSRAKHCQYYLGLAEESYSKLWGKDQGFWLDRLEIEHDNLRKALVRFAEEDPTGDSLLRMAGSLWRFWEVRGYIGEGRAWMSRALANNTNASTYIRANGLRGAGILARQQGDYDEAESQHEQSLALFRQLGPTFNLGAARQLDALGEIEQYHGNYEAAIALHDESLALQKEIGDKEGIAASLGHLGVIARERGRYDEAEELLGQSLLINREQGDRLRIGVDLNNLGLVATLQCQYERALLLHEEAVHQYRDLNNKLGISDSLMNMGDVAKDRGDFRQSDVLYEECLALKKELGDRRGIARTTIRQGTTALLQGDYLRAQDLADQSLVSFNELGIKRGVVVALRVGALVAVYKGDFDRADQLAEESLRLAGQIEALFEAANAEVVKGLSAHGQARLEEARRWFLESLAFFREVNDRRSIAHTLVGLARTAYRLEDHPSAQGFLEESLSLSRKYGIQWSLAYSLEIMGLLRRSEAKYSDALQMFQESLQLSSEQANRQGIANCLGAIAGVAAMLGQPEIAVRLFGATGRIREEIDGSMGLADQQEYGSCLEHAKSQMDGVAFRAAWDEGWGMSSEQAVKEALSDLGA